MHSAFQTYYRITLCMIIPTAKNKIFFHKMVTYMTKSEQNKNTITCKNEAKYKDLLMDEKHE